MKLTYEQRSRAIRVFGNHQGDYHESLIAALDDFLTTTKVAELEALPQRDYRKEMWIAAYTARQGAPSENTFCADQALVEFDQRFPS